MNKIILLILCSILIGCGQAEDKNTTEIDPDFLKADPGESIKTDPMKPKSLREKMQEENEGMTADEAIEELLNGDYKKKKKDKQ